MEPYKQLLYSTRAEDIYALKQLQHQGMGLMEAITALSADRSQS